jgi:transcriptional regulator with XRE-family HTH domain
MARPADIRRLVARNVRRLRKAKGLSQAELATDAGLHQHHVSEIENGQHDLRLRTIDKLARALGVRPRDLFEE